MKQPLDTFLDAILQYPEQTMFDVPDDIYSFAHVIVDKQEAINKLTEHAQHWTAQKNTALFSIKKEVPNYPVVKNGIRSNRLVVVIQMENQLATNFNPYSRP